MSVVEEIVDPRSLIPGAMQETLERALDGGGLIEFEEAPAGWLTQAGEPRKKPWRAYHWTERESCEVCGGDGRVNGKTKVVKCKACAGTGKTKRRRVTSVSQVLETILPKPGLPMWAEAKPRMAPRTLFMSWATPPAKVPRLSIFWDC